MTALPLITIGKDSKFQINQTTLTKLAALGPIAVVSIAGLYRTGKSYLLNRLLGRQSGFQVGPTINPCTKGLYVWGEPIKKDGYSVVLMDTEGLGSVQQDQNHDAKIFSLAILLSSYFIYNSMGTIDERALEGLQLVTNLTKHVSDKADIAISTFMPNFLWCVRDFVLQLVNDRGQAITSSDYLEHALLETSNTDEMSKGKNAVRRCIKTFFPKRDCVTLIRPTLEESELQRIDSIDQKKLRPQFLKDVQALTDKILREAKPQKLLNQVVTGERFVFLIEAFVKAFNSGVAPEIMGTWANVAVVENQKLLKTEVLAYENALSLALKNNPTMNETELQQTDAKLRAEAFKRVKQNGLGEDLSGLIQEYQKLCDNIFQKAEKESNESALAANNTLAIGLYEKLIMIKLRDDSKRQSAANLNTAWSDLEREYEKKARGSKVAKLQALNTLLGTKKSESFVMLIDQLERAQKNDIAQVNLALVASEKKREELANDKHKFELNHVKIENEAKNLAEKLQRVEREKSETESRLKRERDEEKQKGLDSLNRYEAKLKEASDLRKQLDERASRSAELQKKSEESNHAQNEKLKTLEAARSKLAKDLDDLRKQLDEKTIQSVELLKISEESKQSQNEKLKTLEAARKKLMKDLDDERANHRTNLSAAEKKNQLALEEMSSKLAQKEASEAEWQRKQAGDATELLRKLQISDKELQARAKEVSVLNQRLSATEKELRTALDSNTRVALTLAETENKLKGGLAEASNMHAGALQEKDLEINRLKLELNDAQIELNDAQIANLPLAPRSEIDELELESTTASSSTSNNNNNSNGNNNNANNNNANNNNANIDNANNANNNSKRRSPRATNANRSNCTVRTPSKKTESGRKRKAADLEGDHSMQATPNATLHANEPIVFTIEDDTESLHEEDKPQTKKQKTDGANLRRFTIAQLRSQIRELDYTQLPLTNIKKEDLIVILQSLLDKQAENLDMEEEKK